jgi:asparagine synthase (glutamine-hydrolysing)
MYAFVIWEPQSQALFAARDPFGEKPLYYATADDGSLLFASEIKAIEATGTVRRTLDLESIDAYLALGYVPPDRSIWSTVRPLPPGHHMRWTRENTEIVRYWAPALGGQTLGLDDAVERLRELLSQAVERQLVADVPVGAFLSGGHDSSTIVALMAERSTKNIQTFSVGFGQQINELPYARSVARRYGTEHHEIDLGEPAVAELLERMSEVYDEPFADSSSIPTYLISEFAREQVKVVLAGDGGDELFGGYTWYNPLLMAERMTPSYLRWIVSRIASKLLRDRNVRLRRYSAALGLAARWPDTWTRAVMGETYFNVAQRRALWEGRPGAPAPFWPDGLYEAPAGVQGLDRAFYFDLTSYLPGDILVKVDRASMAHGLECRAPLLDRDLAEFALSLPASLKVSSEENKIVFRQAASSFWPEEIRNRAKHGFGAPYLTWLRAPGVRALLSDVTRPGSRLRSLLPGLDSARLTTPSYRAWTLLVLGLWLERRAVDV